MTEGLGNNVVPFNGGTRLEEGKFRVSVIKDVPPEGYPELYLEVWVEGPPEDVYGFPEMLMKAKCTKAVSPEKADLVIFTGGPDVNPILYGADKHPTTVFDTERDNTDIALYHTCMTQGIPMLGVCRGAQFLAVMNGAQLYQHVDGHSSPHNIYDAHNKKTIKHISSVHHQMVIKSEGMQVLADSWAANTRWTDGVADPVRGTKMDVEAYFIRDTLCLGVQGHPEYKGYTEYTIWCLEQIREFLVESPDVEVREKNIRLKLALQEERDARWLEEAKAILDPDGALTGGKPLLSDEEVKTGELKTTPVKKPRSKLTPLKDEAKFTSMAEIVQELKQEKKTEETVH